MQQHKPGFTIVEVLVTIAIIGILAGIAFVSYGTLQQDSRNSLRASRLTIVAEALEKYYNKSGEYPGCTAMTQDGTTVTTTTLTGMDKTALLTPLAPVGTTNSIGCTALSAGSSDIYAYVGDGTATCSTGAACTTFTLQYKEEGSGTIKSIAARH
jgi:type IV pilus assembly protein PilE